MKRQHPIAMLRYTTKNFWLLLIPLLRGLLALGFDLYSWVSGAYLDILIIFAILGFAYLRWCNVYFEAAEDGIKFHTGIFLEAENFIPFENMSVVASKHSFFLRPFKAVIIYIETDSHPPFESHSAPDSKLIMKLTDCKEIYNKIPHKKGRAEYIYKPRKTELLFFSLVFSSALSGVLYFGTLLFQGGRLVSRELEERFITAVNDVTNIAGKLIGGLTPMTVGIIILIAAGWLFSFITNYLRHINFELKKSGRNIKIRNGFFSEWQYHINTERINYVNLRQTAFMKICKVMSVHVSCSGYGKQRREIPVFVPITTRHRVIGAMNLFLPEFTVMHKTVHPRWNYIMRFLLPPTALIFGIMLFAAALVLVFPEWYSIIFFIAVMGELLSYALLIVKFLAYYTNGVGTDGAVVNLSYCRFYQFHRVIIPIEKIVYTEIRQTIFQRMNDSCDFIVYTKGERAKKHRVRCIDLHEATAAAAVIGYDKFT